MATNATIETLLNRRSIRKFKDEPIDDDATATLETVAQHAASSQFLNDWSAIRVSDPAIKARLAEIGNQPYIATAPLLYVFIIDEHRNARIAQRKGIDPTSDEFHLKYSYRFTQAQNDAVLGLALGKPDQEPTLKPRMPRSMQFFDNTYPADDDGMLEQLPDFDNKVHQYYDLRQADRPVDAFSDQIVSVSRQGVNGKTLLDKAAAQGFQLDK